MRELVFVHLLGASVWVGGHLLLLLRVFPKAWQSRDVAAIRAFEQSYEKLGIPALLLQIISGLWLASLWLPPAQWLGDSPSAALIRMKLACLLATALLGAHARLRLIPRLNPDNLGWLGVHIAAITLVSLGFVWAGLSFRVS